MVMIKRARGFSLVELMVTLVISLVAILSMLSLYQGIGRNNAEARLGARLDGQIQLGLLTAHKLLQGAGFNANGTQTSSYPSDLRLISGAVLNPDDNTVGSDSAVIDIAQNSTGSVDSSTTGWALLWRSGNALAGLYAPQGGGLFSLIGNGTNLGWEDNAWAIDNGLVTLPTIIPPNLAGTGQVTITLTRSACDPIGIPIGSLNGGAYSATLAATGYAAAATRVSTTCLINTR